MGFRNFARADGSIVSSSRRCTRTCCCSCSLILKRFVSYKDIEYQRVLSFIICCLVSSGSDHYIPSFLPCAKSICRLNGRSQQLRDGMKSAIFNVSLMTHRQILLPLRIGRHTIANVRPGRHNCNRFFFYPSRYEYFMKGLKGPETLCRVYCCAR